jgi:hypothetical protein
VKAPRFVCKSSGEEDTCQQCLTLSPDLTRGQLSSTYHDLELGDPFIQQRLVMLRRASALEEGLDHPRRIQRAQDRPVRARSCSPWKTRRLIITIAVASEKHASLPCGQKGSTRESPTRATNSVACPSLMILAGQVACCFLEIIEKMFQTKSTGESQRQAETHLEKSKMATSSPPRLFFTNWQWAGSEMWSATSRT